MYRLIPLRSLRRTKGVKFDEIVPSDIPSNIDGIDRVIHGPYGMSPASCEGVKRPWYMHPSQDDNLMVLQGERFVDIYCAKQRQKTSFIITPDKVYKDGQLYIDHPSMVVWPAGIFHRIVSGDNGSISINFAVRRDPFDITTNFNIYDVNEATGEYRAIRDGHLDQPNHGFPSYSSRMFDLLNG